MFTLLTFTPVGGKFEKNIYMYIFLGGWDGDGGNKNEVWVVALNSTIF